MDKKEEKVKAEIVVDSADVDRYAKVSKKQK